MPEIDDVSLAIGEIKTMNAVINAKLDKIDEKLTIQNGSISKAHARIDEAQRVNEDYTKMKSRGILALFGLSLAGGAGSAGALKALSVLFGGG